MKINDLQNGMAVKCRIGRLGREAPKWEEWTTVDLYVQRRQSDLPKCYRSQCPHYWHKDDICLVALQLPGTAEYRPEDFQNGIFVCEDYCFEIDGLQE